MVTCQGQLLGPTPSCDQVAATYVRAVGGRALGSFDAVAVGVGEAKPQCRATYDERGRRVLRLPISKSDDTRTSITRLRSQRERSATGASIAPSRIRLLRIMAFRPASTPHAPSNVGKSIASVCRWRKSSACRISVRVTASARITSSPVSTTSERPSALTMRRSPATTSSGVHHDPRDFRSLRRTAARQPQNIADPRAERRRGSARLRRSPARASRARKRQGRE